MLKTTGFKIGVRHIQMLYMFASAIVIGIIRASMGVAVLAISDPTRRNDTYIKVFFFIYEPVRMFVYIEQLFLLAFNTTSMLVCIILYYKYE